MMLNRMQYSGLFREFASHGMLVVAIDHQDGSCDYTANGKTGKVHLFNDKKDHFELSYRNKQVGVRAVEMSQVIDEITDKDYCQRVFGT
jgi:hypothetical protein